MKKLLSAPKYLDQILKEGNLSAQEISNKNITMVKEIIDFYKL